MDQAIEDLLQHIKRSPLDEALRIQLENHLASTSPESPILELLRRESRIAQALDDGLDIRELMESYTQFHIAQSTFLWDLRGRLDHVYRPFSLWLMQYRRRLRCALELALQHKLGAATDIDSPPSLLAQLRLEDAFNLRLALLDFVRRYKGPSGNESEVEDHEVEILILASHSKKAPVVS